MDKIKRFITCHVPVYACNFRCGYCYVGQHPNAYKNGIKPFFADVKKIAQSFSVTRLGGYCYFNLCAAGETMLHPSLIDLVCLLTKQGHFVDIITNGTVTTKLNKLVDVLDDEQKKHLFMKFSFHYIELKKRNLIEEYIKNVYLIKDNGISYTIEITPHDELVPYINEIKDFSLLYFGALPHITVARNENTKEIALLSKYSHEEYKNIWRVFDSPLFDFKFSIFNKKRCEFCYAGEWSLYANLLTGDYYQCYEGDYLGNLRNIEKEFNFRPIGRCRLPHCFNGHAFLAFGDIPELQTPSYAMERNRVCKDGTEFLQENIKLFFSSRLKDNNKCYSTKKKRIYVLRSIFGRKINKFWKKIIFLKRKEK